MALLLYSIIFGIVTAFIANNKGRNGTFWFMIGLLFGIFGFIASLLVSNLKKQENSIVSNNKKTNINSTNNTFKKKKITKLSNITKR